MDRGEQLLLEFLVVERERSLERADQVADDIFGRVVDQGSEAIAAVETGRKRTCDSLDEKAVLGHREGVIAGRLAVPAGDPGEPVGDVLDLDVEWRWIQEISLRPLSMRCQARGSGTGAALGMVHPLLLPNRWEHLFLGTAIISD